jgi:HSP20 family protein
MSKSLIPWRRKRENGHDRPGDLSLAQLRSEFDTMFDRFFRDPWGFWDRGESLSTLAATPRMDLSETENEVTVTMELPGVRADDVDIRVTGDLLTVHGEKKDQREEKKADYHFVERQYGGFQRTVQLPSTVDPDKVDASFKDGVLTITVAKHPHARPRQIKVRAT